MKYLCSLFPISLHKEILFVKYMPFQFPTLLSKACRIVYYYETFTEPLLQLWLAMLGSRLDNVVWVPWLMWEAFCKHATFAWSQHVFWHETRDWLVSTEHMTTDRSPHAFVTYRWTLKRKRSKKSCSLNRVFSSSLRENINLDLTINNWVFLRVPTAANL